MRQHIPKKTKQAVKRTIRKRLRTHERLLTHPLVMFLVLCAGVLMGCWTLKVYSDSYSVNAVVPASPLPSGAYITNPASGSTFLTTPIDISGTCPSQSYVDLYTNSLFSGSAWCNDGNFTIQTGLALGANTLLAQDYNITNQPGPTTPEIDVTYAVASEPTLPAPEVTQLLSASGQKAPTVAVQPKLPLVETSNYSFKTFGANTPFSWNVALSGGVNPYVLQVDWGDGNTNTLPAALGSNTIEHTYTEGGYYAILARAVDGLGGVSYIQLAALVETKNSVGFIGSTCQQSNSCVAAAGQQTRLTSSFSNWMWLSWSSYVAVVLMIISFLLGQRQEYRHLTKRYSSMLR